MMSKTLRFVNSKQAIKCKAIRQQMPTQHPSEWFADKKKPVVHLRGKVTDLTKLRKMVIRGINQGQLDRDVAKMYLHTLGKTLVDNLDEDWVTYGVVIKPKGGVAISDLYEAEVKDEMAATAEEGTEDAPDFDVALAVLFIHRLVRLSAQASRDVYYDNLKKQLTRKDTHLFKSITRLSEYASWQSDRDYNKIVAAYDMFFFRFQNHDFAALRYGSIASRFRDCASLTSITHICDVLGIEPELFPDWIYHVKAGQELMSVCHDADIAEAETPFSYFPYQADMGFVLKSAYSSVAAPNVFFLIHAIGCFMRSQRSLNARMNPDCNATLLVKNALIVAAAFKSLTVLDKAFTESGAYAETDALMAEDTGVTDPDAFSTLDGGEVFEIMARRQFRPTKLMMSVLNNYKKEVKNLREGTIGKFLSTYTLE